MKKININCCLLLNSKLQTKNIMLFLLIIFFITKSYSQEVDFISSNLPIVIIDTFGETIPDEPKINADMGIIYNGPGEINNMTDPFNHYNGHIGIEIRGHSSQNFPKKQYGLETRDSEGENLNVSLFNMPAENDWILNGPYSDKSLMRNVLAYETARAIGWYAPRIQFCEVVLNGEYVGLYVFMEKIKKDNNRVDLSDPDEENISGGYLLEIEWWTRLDSNDVYFASETIDRPYVIKFPKNEDITDDIYNWIENYTNEFEANLYSDSFTDPDSGYIQYINLPSWIDYVLLNEAFRNNDVFFSSTYLYKEQDEKIVAGPVWDFNIAMGNVNYGNNWLTEGWWLTENPWSARLLEDSNYVNTYKIRWNELRQQQLSTSSMNTLIDNYVELILEAQERNFIRWPVLGNYVWPNYFIGETYEEEIVYLKQWVEDRFSWIDSQFEIDINNYPVINEINYHSADDFDSEDWIEIYNPGELSLNLSGWIFKDEDDDHKFIFPAGTSIQPDSYLILCRDSVAFHQHFPQVQNYIGNFDFSLSNGGEMLRLFNPLGSLIDFVCYNDSDPWPEEPDGDGSTLELRNLPRDNFHVSNWGTSSGHGTPGAINSIVTGISPEKTFKKNNFILKQNYPNPFNPKTVISYQLSVNSLAELTVYNVLGQEVETLFLGMKTAGQHQVEWNANKYASGIYYYKLKIGSQVQTRKMLFLK